MSVTRLLRLGPRGTEVPAVEWDGVVFDLRPLTDDITGGFLESDGIPRARDAARDGKLPELDGADGMRIGAPIARPSAVLGIGQNYAAHAAESGSAPPAMPVLFLTHPNTIVGPNDDVILPRSATKLDWEVELGVVIGRPVHELASIADAAANIAGYTISHDVSEREWQREHSGGQWAKGKTAPTFNPLGPALIPADEVADIGALRIWSRVNGEPRQDSSTGDMIFPVDELVWHLSQYCRLEAGDLINTGTPAGVAMSGRFDFLRDGDVVELGIDGLGVQRQRIVAAGA